MSEFTLKFFARLKEEVGVEELKISLSDVSTTADLVPYLVKQNPSWVIFLNEKLLTAVNQQMTNESIKLRDRDEVALFPPVTGG